jgi:hypothetical protein
MGQYHYIANLDKKEYLDPHQFGDGLKLMEFGNSAGGTLTGLTILLGVSNGRGGGDLHLEDGDPMAEIVGSWGGDRIAIIGDYFADDDIPGYDIEDNPWNDNENWTDISPAVRHLVSLDGCFKFDIEKMVTKDAEGNILHEHDHVRRVEAY